ncbi:MAG: FtsL-like putative cell division protein [Paludibacter sp.]|nr:FtsL-like putative cell division protein [Paludibacter sp.]MDD4199076.1 FtsL-like putative cell division protein [Paludibacter sp.]MDD4428123.1 FtsL-like putative cell division protein [Paludibacter sp.]
MSFFKNIVEKIRQSEDLSDIRSSSVRDILNGNILTKKFIRKQYLLIILLVVLSIVYIDNRYYSEKQIARVVTLKKNIQDAKYESLTISAELMEISRQSNILLLLQSKGLQLKPGSTPPIVIE